MPQPRNILVWVISLNRSITQALRISLANNNPADDPQWNQNDLQLLQIYFCNEISNTLTPTQYAAGTVIAVGAQATIDGVLTSLFSGDNFTLMTDGGNPFYQGEVDLSGEALATWLGANESSSVLVDVQVADALGGEATQRLTVAKPTVEIYLDGFNSGNPATTVQPQFALLSLLYSKTVQNRMDIGGQTGGAGVAASYSTAFGGNADLTFTATQIGNRQNNITIRYVNPMANNAALAVTVANWAITVSLATGAGGAITSTGAQVQAAVNASVAAANLVTASLKAGSSGAGVVSAFASQNLAGGVLANLDSVPTQSGAYPAQVGWKVEINDNDASRWRCDWGDGTADDNSVVNVRVKPLDYNPAKPKVWNRYA